MKANRFHHSLRVKIILVLLLPLLAIFSAVSFAHYASRRNSLLENLRGSVANAAADIQDELRSGVQSDDLSSVRRIMTRIGQSIRFDDVLLLDEKGLVMVAANAESSRILATPTAAGRSW